jgi:hypothetical protein
VPAVILNRDGLHVAVVDNDVVHIRKITLVRDLDTVIEASAGVKEGDLVALNPPVDFAEGRKVTARTVKGHGVAWAGAPSLSAGASAEAGAQADRKCKLD